MRQKAKTVLKTILLILIVLFIFYYLFSYAKPVKDPDYGVSFNTVYAKELGLNWKEVYDAIIKDMGAEKIRLAAHWNMVEPERDEFNFKELDYQVDHASFNGTEVILAIGKRLPRWPECHVPEWADDLSKEEQEAEILEYLEAVVLRYKDNEHIKIWQVENEPFLSLFAKDYCLNFDSGFLDTEIDLVESLDPDREILVTDSGELSTWGRAYKRGDIFGTTLYLYAWNEVMGDFRSFVLPGFYSGKRNFWNMIYGEKEAIIAELSLEPWLDKPVIEEKIEVQVHRMSPKNFDKVLEFAKQTGFKTQYLWGAEWWYYMKLQGEPWYWERGKEIFSKE